MRTLLNLLQAINTKSHLAVAITLTSLDTFFSTIKDGTWHSIETLSTQLDLSKNRLTELCKYLADKGLIKYDEETQKIKIQSIWSLILPKEIEPKQPEKSTIANFIIPPNGNIEIQQTKISNLSNIEIELTVRLEDKITEIAIKA